MLILLLGFFSAQKKDASIAKYSVLNSSEQLFASRYMLVLLSEEELRKELEREREIISEELAVKSEDLDKDEKPK